MAVEPTASAPAHAPGTVPGPVGEFVRASTRVLSEGPVRGRRPLRLPSLPARVRIMAWLVLLLLVVLATVVAVTRNLLVADVERDTTASLVQEVEEFGRRAEVVRAGPSPGGFVDGRDLLTGHLDDQIAGADEILLGVTAGGEVLPVAARPSPVEVALAEVAGRPARTGEIVLADLGRVRWATVPVLDAGGAPDGTYVVASAVDRRLRAVDETVRTLGAVSLAGLGVAGLASWVLSGQILAPVNTVRRAAAALTSDDLTRRIPVTGSDDIAALAEQYNAMLDRLEQSFATQRRFLDDASHELRTPITIVRGNLEFVEDDDPAERAEVVRLCTDELDRMHRIVEELLLLAKAEQPDFVLVRETSLVDLTSDIHAKLPALGERRWQLDAIAEGEARLDAQRVTQAMVQLAQNAVAHTRAGDAVGLGSARDVDGVTFWIRDGGPGVRAEDAAAIFERFARGADAHRTEARRVDTDTGAGLGLAIVTAIAEGHGGHVELESVPGRGATFTLRLPHARGERPCTAS